jgi:hypothetical protein
VHFTNASPPPKTILLSKLLRAGIGLGRGVRDGDGAPVSLEGEMSRRWVAAVPCDCQRQAIRGNAISRKIIWPFALPLLLTMLSFEGVPLGCNHDINNSYHCIDFGLQ